MREGELDLAGLDALFDDGVGDGDVPGWRGGLGAMGGEDVSA